MKKGIVLLILAMLVLPAAAAWSCLVCSDVAGTWRGTYEITQCPPPEGNGNTTSGNWVMEIKEDCSGTFYSVESGLRLFQVEFCGNTFCGGGTSDCGEVTVTGTVNDDTLSGTVTFSLGGGGSFQGRRVTDIPALSEWGMAALGLVLALCAVLLLRRRRGTLTA
jgi:hypothetical protein